MHRTLRTPLASLFLAAALNAPTLAADDEPQEIAKLKPLHRRTALVENGRPAATIVAPATPLGTQLADRLQQRLKRLTGLDFPVMPADEKKPRELLQTRHAIVLGCMANNKFFEHLYREWFLLTDRWYPGPGGRVLRSVHSPYGTGRNAILLGASDETGLRAAVAAFEKVLAKGTTLPWLMDIKLGDGHAMPEEGPVPILLRPFSDRAGVETGWHAAGKLMLQYVYSGDVAYAEKFKALVKEKPESISAANHYGGGQTQILVWDLVEESPVFTDAERLAITRLFLTHLRSGETHVKRLEKGAKRGFRGNFPERHGMTRRQAAAAETRYFARDYPGPEFARYKEWVDAYFDPLMTRSKVQNDVALQRYTSYLEPILAYALQNGRDDFLLGEPLRLWADRMVAHVPPMGSQKRDAPFITLRTVAQLRQDGQYRYIAELALAMRPTSLSEFTSGQAWAGDVKPVKPTRYTGVCVLRPEPREYSWVRSKVAPEHGFDKVTFRNGFDPDSLWLQLDGVDGGPGGKRTPDVMAIKWLGCFGRRFLRFWTGATYTQSALCVARNGLAENRPRTAELVRAADLPGCGYVHARTKQYPGSHWSRHLVWDKPANWIAVFDRVLATEPGRFLASAFWVPHGSTLYGVDGELTENADGFRIVSRLDDKPPATLHVRNVLGLPRKGRTTLAGGNLSEGEDLWLVHLLALSPGDDAQPPVTRCVGPNAFLVGEKDPVLVGIGNAAADVFGGTGNIRAAAFRISRTRAQLMGATELRGRKLLFQATHPVDIELAADGTAVIETSQGTALVLAPGSHSTVDGKPAGTRVTLAKGRHHATGLSWAGSTLDKLLANVSAASPPQRVIATLPENTRDWTPSVEAKVAGKPSAFAATGTGAVLGYKDGAVRAVDMNGEQRWTFQAGQPITKLQAAAPGEQVPWRVLGATADGQVFALRAGGRRLWMQALKAGAPGKWRGPYVRGLVMADRPDNGGPGLFVADNRGWFTMLDPGTGAELKARHVLSRLEHSELLFPRVFTTRQGARQIVVGHKSFYGGGWLRVSGKGRILKREGGSWGGGRVCGVAVADFDGDGDQDVCVARYRERETIALYTDADKNAWKVWTDTPVKSLAALPLEDGRHLVAAGTRSVVVLDPKDGGIVWNHCTVASVRKLLPMPGSHLTAVLSDGRLVLFDVKGRPLRQAEAGDSKFRTAAAPNGSALWSVTDAGQLRRFDTGTR